MSLAFGADDLEVDAEAEVTLQATGLGYEYVAERRRDARERPVYVHRLAAVAWGILDGLDDEREVHHEVPEAWRSVDGPDDAGIPWLQAEHCLIAEQPAEHARRHINR